MELEKSWASAMHQDHSDFAKHKGDSMDSSISQQRRQHFRLMWRVRERMAFLIRNLQFYIQVKRIIRVSTFNLHVSSIRLSVYEYPVLPYNLVDRSHALPCIISTLSLSLSVVCISLTRLPSDLVLCNRGKKFCTTIDTLTQREPDSMLAAKFSGRHTVNQDSDKGYVFIDRDGKHFRHILNWLRDGVIPSLTDSEYSELSREAEYYQLLGLAHEIKSSLIRRKEDEETDTELTRLDIIKCIQTERVRFRGLNLAGLDLSKLDLSYVDFRYACIKNVFFSRANLQCAKF